MERNHWSRVVRDKLFWFVNNCAFIACLCTEKLFICILSATADASIELEFATRKTHVHKLTKNNMKQDALRESKTLDSM